MNLEFPNLLYYIDENIRLTQSGAIIRYLARKHDMVAKTEDELQLQDVIDGVLGLGDIRGSTSNLVYRSQYYVGWFFCWRDTLAAPVRFQEEAKIEFRKDTLEPNLKELDQKLAGKDFIIGNRLTHNDFILFEILDIQGMMFENVLDSYPGLQRFHDRIKNLKGVKEFLQSDRSPLQMNGATAKFGGKPLPNPHRAS